MTIVFNDRRNDGSTVTTKAVSVTGLAHAQLSLASLFDSATFFDLTRTDLYLSYTVSNGPALVYAVVADNRTDDSYFVSPVCN